MYNPSSGICCGRPRFPFDVFSLVYKTDTIRRRMELSRLVLMRYNGNQKTQGEGKVR